MKQEFQYKNDCVKIKNIAKNIKMYSFDLDASLKHGI